VYVPIWSSRSGRTSLREKDGPMLLHGLQGFQGSRTLIPARRALQPDRDFLAERYEIFRKAG
jgi:putative restriction endonuclease